MIFVLLTLPLMIMILGLYLYPSYSEGKQIVNGGSLYSNQEPKLK